MAAIKFMSEVNGTKVYFMLVTTERPNSDGYFGAKLFDSEFNSINFTVSPKREECLKQVKKHIPTDAMRNIVNLQGYNIPTDVKDLLLKK